MRDSRIACQVGPLSGSCVPPARQPRAFWPIGALGPVVGASFAAKSALAVRAAANACRYQPFHEDKGTGLLRHCLLRRGVAETLQAAAGSGKSVADFRREAVGFGAKLFVCPTALASHGVGEDELIPGLAGHAGAAAFIGRTLDPAWRTLSF